jgi:DNA-binding response OmpR family regulator
VEILSNILIIEDDIALSNGIKFALKGEDISFSQAYDLTSAKSLMEKEHYHLLLLDINLPDGNGFDYLNELRKSSDIPVIILTANDMEVDIVTGLELGANDYVTKPFSLMVLRARVKAQLRNQVTLQDKTITINHFRFNFDAMEYMKNGIWIELSKTEQKLLKYLVLNKGKTLTREMLTDKIWSDGAVFVDENALSVTIKRLRDKLEENPSKPNYIKTVYGIGYTWNV